MRIVILAEWLANLGGCEHFTATLCAALARAGHQVVLAVATGEVHPRWRAEAGGEIVVFAEAGGEPADRLAELVARHRAQLVHAVPYEATAFAYVTRPDAVPVVGTEPSDGGDRCYWWYVDEVLRRHQPRFRALHVFSARAERHAREFYGYAGPIARIAPTCRFDAGVPLWDRAQPSGRCAFLGRLAVEKGLTFAFDAFSGVLAAEWPDLRLDVWGGGPLEPVLRELSAAAGLRRTVDFRGPFAHAFAVPLEEYDFVLIPSYFEGLPYVFLECMWRGVPVVMTTHSGAPDLEGIDGLCRFVTPGDHASLAAAVRSLYDGFGGLRADACARRALVARHCDPEHGARQFVDLYRQALESA